MDFKPNSYILVFNNENVCIDKFEVEITENNTNLGSFVLNEDSLTDYSYISKDVINSKPHGTIIVREPQTQEIRFVTQPENTSKYIGNGMWI